MTPDVQAILKNHPLPWRHDGEYPGFPFKSSDGQVFGLGVSDPEAIDTIIALANAHATEPAQERYYVTSSGSARFFQVFNRRHSRCMATYETENYPKGKAKAAAEREAARLNAESEEADRVAQVPEEIIEIDEAGIVHAAKTERYTVSAIVGDDAVCVLVRRPSGLSKSYRTFYKDVDPGAVENAEALARELNAEAKPAEGALPERPWRVTEHVGGACVEIVRDFTGGDGLPRTACLMRLDRARGSSSVSDAQWQRQKGYLRHMVACVNAIDELSRANRAGADWTWVKLPI